MLAAIRGSFERPSKAAGAILERSTAPVEPTEGVLVTKGRLTFRLFLLRDLFEHERTFSLAFLLVVISVPALGLSLLRGLALPGILSLLKRAMPEVVSLLFAAEVVAQVVARAGAGRSPFRPGLLGLPGSRPLVAFVARVPLHVSRPPGVLHEAIDVRSFG